MSDDIQKKTLEEIEELKDLFLRRLLDDKVKMAAIEQLRNQNEELQKKIDEKSLKTIANDLILLCDRIERNNTEDDFIASVKEEILEILARREIYPMTAPTFFDPSIHNAVGTELETEERPEKSVVRVTKKGYMFRDKVFRPANVVVAVKNVAGLDKVEKNCQ